VMHLLLVTAFVVTSVMAPGVLPSPVTRALAFVSRDVVLPRSLPPVSRRRAGTTPSVPTANPDAAPVVAPNAIAPETFVDSPPDLLGEIEAGSILSGEIATGIVPLTPPPPPPPVPEPVKPLRVGGIIRPPTKIKDVRPVYPAIAQAARVEGTVIIEATIGPTGRVVDAQPLRSIPLLDGAALEAVRQWVFTPTLLNGTPVPVLMTVTVRFELK
jgi:protein TonB